MRRIASYFGGGGDGIGGGGDGDGGGSEGLGGGGEGLGGGGDGCGGEGDGERRVGTRGLKRTTGLPRNNEQGNRGGEKTACTAA